MSVMHVSNLHLAIVATAAAQLNIGEPETLARHLRWANNRSFLERYGSNAETVPFEFEPGPALAWINSHNSADVANLAQSLAYQCDCADTAETALAQAIAAALRHRSGGKRLSRVWTV